MRPGREPPVHATGSTSRAVEREIFEDNRRLALLGELHESLRDEMQPLTDAIPLPASFSAQQAAHDPAIVRLLRREPSSASEVGCLDSPNATKWKTRRDHAPTGSYDSVQRVFIRIEGNRPLRLVRLRRLLPDDEDNLARDHREGTEAPRRITQERAVPFGERQVKLHTFRPSDRDAEASRLAVEPIGLVLRLEHESPHERDGGPSLSIQTPAMRVQDGQRDLEGRRDVLLVDDMPTAQNLVGGASESGPRPDVLSKGDADRLVDQQPKFREEPVQRRGIPPDLEDQGPMDVHRLPWRRGARQASQGRCPKVKI